MRASVISPFRAREIVRGRGAQSDLSIFQPDIVLPKQFWDTFKKEELGPEKALLLGVLESAVHDFQKHIFAKHAKERALFSNAEDWIATPGQHYMFSFDNVCSGIGLDPSYVRKGLMNWRDSKRVAFAEEIRSRRR